VETRAAWEYSGRKWRTQGRTRENEGKNAIFFRGCAKRAAFMRVSASFNPVAGRFGVLSFLFQMNPGEAFYEHIMER
jgi:hypothetical protein